MNTYINNIFITYYLPILHKETISMALKIFMLLQHYNIIILMSILPILKNRFLEVRRGIIPEFVEVIHLLDSNIIML